MCFFSKQTKDAITLENRFNAKIEDIEQFQTSDYYNGFTYPKTPVITNEDRKTIQMINWGLHPYWAKEDWNKSYTLNARIETLIEKPSFRNITQNRCIVIVDGFYEWQHIGNRKVKYEVGFDNALFALAGLFDSNKKYKSYTIITTEAKGIMQKIHNSKLRMPVTLKTDTQMQNWLDGKHETGQWDFSVILV